MRRWKSRPSAQFFQIFGFCEKNKKMSENPSDGLKIPLRCYIIKPYPGLSGEGEGCKRAYEIPPQKRLLVELDYYIGCHHCHCRKRDVAGSFADERCAFQRWCFPLGRSEHHLARCFGQPGGVGQPDILHYCQPVALCNRGPVTFFSSKGSQSFFGCLFSCLFRLDPPANRAVWVSL